MVKVLGYVLKVSEFKLQSRYWIHFWINALEKGMNGLIPNPNNWIGNITAVLLQGVILYLKKSKRLIFI